MTVRIVQSRRFHLDLLVEGKSFFEITPYSEREMLYEKALNRLDREINDVAEIYKRNDLGAFLWCFTYDTHRVDGVAHTVLNYYILEILARLKKDNDNLSVTFEVEQPSYFYAALKYTLKIAFEDKAPLILRWKRLIRYRFGPIQRILAQENFLCIKKKHTEIKSDESYILYDINSDLTRLKGFPNYLTSKGEKINILDHSLDKIKAIDSENILTLGLRSSLKDWFDMVRKGIKLWRLTKSLKVIGANKSIFVYVISNQSFFQSFYMVYKERLFYRTFTKLKPSKLYVSTTFGDPVKRLAISTANSLGIDTAVFSCRPYITKMRSEDRLIEADILNYNQTTIGRSFYVLDKWSREHLISSGYQGGVIDYRFNVTGVELKEKCINFNKGIMFLFADQYLNKGLMYMADLLISENYKIDVLYYREHPLVKISESVIRKLKTLSHKVICLTGTQWNALTFDDTLAITCNTTAAIDAVNRGCSLLWLPFISEQSLQFSEVMNAVGHKSVNYDEAVYHVKEFLKQPSKPNDNFKK